MNIYSISDLHLSFSSDKPMFVFGPIWNEHWEKISLDWDAKVQEHDCVLLPGDLSWALSLPEAEKDLFEISKRKGIKVFVRGNHDYWCSSSTGIRKIRDSLPENINIIRHDSIKIGNYVICGSRGWTIPEKGITVSDSDKKIIDREAIRIRMSLDDAALKREPEDKLILMIHFPPFNSSYDDSIFTRIFEEYKVDSVVYGHLHGKTSKTSLYIEKNNIKYYLTSCDLRNNKLTLIY